MRSTRERHRKSIEAADRLLEKVSLEEIRKVADGFDNEENMTSHEVRESFKEMVEYLLAAENTDDQDVIEGYTDSLIIGSKMYANAIFNELIRSVG